MRVPSLLRHLLRREARVQLGGLGRANDELTDVRTGALMEQLWQDVRYGARMLRRNPAFTIVATATLAIGIGANAAIFTVVNAVLLRPLPYAAPDALFSIAGMSYTGEFVELQRRARAFEVAAYVERQATLMGDGDPLRLAVASVSSNAIALLGADALLGRPLAEGDERAADGAVVVVGHQLWRTRFGGDPGIVGRRITLDGTARTVVGVMPADFGFPAPETQAWIPSAIDTRNRIGLWSTSRRMVGRVRPGFTLAQADAEIRATAPGMRELFPWRMPADYGRAASAVPLKEALVKDVRAMLLMLLGAVSVVLLIASVNVSNLLVARTLARQRELAIRASMGAARGRILRQVLTEGLLLVLVGLAAGVPLAYVGVGILAASLPADMPRPVTLALDSRLLAFGAAAVSLSALIIGLFPAMRASRVDLVPRLAEGERTGQSRRTRWTSNMLVGSQVALAVLLVVTAVLLVRTLANLNAVTPGFRVDEVISARISPPQVRFPDVAARRALYGSLLERVSAVPGVTNAALTDRLPFSGDTFGSVFVIEGRPDPASTGEWPLADVSGVVSPTLFATLDVAVRDGRAFTPADTDTSQRVAIVSETLARRYWPGESPIGRRFTFPGDAAGMRTIVGVVSDVKWERVTDTAKAALFVPMSQGAPGAMRLVVRTTGDPAATLEHVRSVVRSLDRDTPMDQGRTMTDLVADAAGQPRFAAALVAAFAVAGLLLGAIGIYGTVADHVAQRRREIGLRMALGAGRRDVFQAVLGGTMAVVLCGAATGLMAAASATRLLAGMLFGVTATDPLTFAAAAGTLALTAALAGYLPARRAAALDPLSVLKAN